MTYTLFISDIHLQEETPRITTAFLDFIRKEAPKADALYILGDCFEAWVGDDDQSAFNQMIILALRQLTEQGTPVYFMRGNRDFLIGDGFARQTGVTLLPDPAVIHLYGQSVLLSHGDLLCTLDRKHQAYRKKVNWRWLQRLFLMLPLSVRRKIAARLRRHSQQYNQQVPSHITDVSDEAVIALMNSHQTCLLIHGHTHRPAIHDVLLQHQSAKRIVLGAWHTKSSVLVFENTHKYQLQY